MDCDEDPSLDRKERMELVVLLLLFDLLSDNSVVERMLVARI